MNFFRFKNMLLIVFFFSCFLVPGFSQNKVKQNEIVWKKEYSTYKNVNNKKGFAKLFNFIFEKKDRALVAPVSVFSDNDNVLWITDRALHELVAVKKNKIINISRIFKNENILSSPIGLCVFPDNTVLFTDSDNGKVYFFNNKTNTSGVFNKNDTLIRPAGIAYSVLTEEVFVSEAGAHRISVFDKNGKLLRIIGQRGNADGEFNFPGFIWIDDSGVIYIVDALNFRVQIFDKNGKFVKSFGKHGDGTGSFACPKGIASDTFGNIYVVDALFNVVQIFDRNGRFLYAFGKKGQDKGEFWMPTGIFIDSDNNIYVADSYNSRVQVFQLISKEKYEN